MKATRICLGDLLDEYWELKKRADVVTLAPDDAHRVDYLRGILNQVRLREARVDSHEATARTVTDSQSWMLQREHLKKVARGEAKPWQPPI
uniref:Uncharacterized protein n=1 Tax=viral metagenome TaxID=1070528 RepID=A0A6M3IYY1_9ZZZZ